MTDESSIGRFRLDVVDLTGMSPGLLTIPVSEAQARRGRERRAAELAEKARALGDGGNAG